MIFSFSFPVTLTFDLVIFALLVTVVQCHVSTKLEVSTSFLFRDNWRHRRDRRLDRCNT